MAVVDVHLHVGSGITVGPLERLVGIVQVGDPNAETNGHEPGDVGIRGLAFTDVGEDGKTTVHVYALDDTGRQAVIQQLTGGVVLPTLKTAPMI